MSETPFLIVGICSKEHVTQATHSALRRLFQGLPFPFDEDIEPGGGLVLGRNLIAGRFHQGINRAGARYARKPTHLLLVDDDVGGFTSDDVVRMVEAGEDVIGAPIPGRGVDLRCLFEAMRRRVPKDRLHFHLSPLLVGHLPAEERRPIHKGHLYAVSHMSTGFLLVTRRAIETMIADLPDSTAIVEGREVTTLFEFGVDRARNWIGEDVGFCLRWRALGGSVYADTKTSLIHMGQQAFFAEPLETLLASVEETRADRS
jgi:hypothetical protein